MTRNDDITEFLTRAGFGDWTFEKLTADASFRQYYRGRFGSESRILMDAPPENGEDIQPFLFVTKILHEYGLRAPQIHTSDASRGFIIMEDFGDDLIANWAKTNPADEALLYDVALDCLAKIWSHPAPNGIAAYDRATYHREAGLVLDWYCTGLSQKSREAFFDALDAALHRVSKAQPVLVLRDYHAENLIWRPQNDGTDRMGLLDYQDALIGHPAYDLVSLIEDARRVVPSAITDRLIARAADTLGLDEQTFRADIAILGAQRNLKIIGIFARLYLRDGKTKYPPLIPHVFDLLQIDLANPATRELSHWCATHLPAPTEDFLQSLMRRT